MGAVRTTFAMVAALLVRRKQILNRGGSDPYALNLKAVTGMTPLSSTPGTNTVSNSLSIDRCQRPILIIQPTSAVGFIYKANSVIFYEVYLIANGKSASTIPGAG